MSDAKQLAQAFGQTMQIFPDRSRLTVGGTEFAFHCDKFNTRITKNLEDVLGVEEGGELLRASAERTTHEFLARFLCGPAAAQFNPLSPADRLQAVFEIFKLLAYGSLHTAELGPASAVFTSTSTYLSEGWLENQKRWRWEDREDPVCHDIRGYLGAALSLAFDKPLGSYRVSELKCRAMGADECRFVAEVI